MPHQTCLLSLGGTGLRLGGLSFLQQMIIPTNHPGEGGSGGSGKTCRGVNRHHLVSMGAATIILAILFSLNYIKPAESVIMPPHKSLYGLDQRDSNHTRTAIELAGVSRSAEGASSDEVGLAAADNVPYLLTIAQVTSVSVSIDGKSNITVNLNRAVSEDVSVLLTVNSGPNLIAFDKSTAENGSLISSREQQNSSRGNKTDEYTIVYAANTFGDRVVNFHTGHQAGHAEIVCHVVKQPSKRTNITIDDKQAFISVNIYKNRNLNVIIQIVGWIYFFAWSISFYFQVILNYQRKSVVGLNFDFLVMNLLGFTCYSIYNFTLLFSYAVQQEYYKRYTYSRIPVEYNDLFFALHAFAITLVTVLQCFIYERGDQQISLPTGIFVSLASALGFVLFITGTFFHALSILDVVLYLSYVKLIITIIKYSPQAYMNYKRKATTGWSIHNIILDFTGGSFSILQMILIAYNYDDWISISGNATKFGLGLFSMAFDILFFIQHYVLYRSSSSSSQGRLVGGGSENDLENSSDSVPSPIISQSVRTANNTTNQTNAVSAGDLETNASESEDTE